MSFGHLFVISGASGVGKSTILKRVMEAMPDLQFSVSATSRPAREGETNGVQYFFVTEDAFRQMISQGAFVEYDYHMNNYYGTLKSEIERIQSAGRTIVFDIDVKGGINLKRIFGDDALAIFIAPPSVEELSRRLHGRGDTSEEMIQKRLAKAEIEMADAPYFDKIIVNDDLCTAKQELDKLVR